MLKCKKFLVFANQIKDKDLIWSKTVVDYIRIKGADAELHISGKEDETDTLETDADVVIAMGGDGTMLRVAHILDKNDIPVIGVNLGTVGFLTEVTKLEIESMVDRLLIGDYSIEQRMMLTGTVITKDGETSHDALNDIVLARESALRLIALSLRVNGKLFDTIEADGIIFSTPTGSTGYNLSAGGPIVVPGTRLIVMTPISPYSLSKRSVVFGADDVLEIELLEKRKDADNKGLVAFDGAENYHMNVGDRVRISVSDNTTRLIKLDDSNVYEILKKKLG